MKYFFVIFLTALIVGLGVAMYFKGWLPTLSFQKPQAVSVQNTEVSNLSVAPLATPVVTSTPSAGPSGTVVEAGGTLSMSKYSVNVPPDWQYSRNGSGANQADTLALTNGANKIIISQGAFGGGVCVYPGDPDTPMSLKFISFTEFSDASNDSLRLGTISAGQMAVCQKKGTAWVDIGSFGHISVTTSSPSTTILAEINLILSSLKKI